MKRQAYSIPDTLFFLLLAINLLPVLGVDYFFTGDGPAHLYNSNLILQLGLSADAPAADFFHLRNALIPNMGGHLLLAFFNWFLPARLAEQTVFSLALILVALGFRYALHSFGKKSNLGMFLILPLLHNFCFYIGFQSFCLSLGLMLFSIGYFVNISPGFTLKKLLLLAGLLFITAVFHLFAAIIATLFIGVFFLRKAMLQRKFYWAPLIAIAPTLFFCFWYIFANAGSSSPEWPNPAEIATDVLRARPLITLSANEATMSIAYAVLLLLAVAISVYRSKKSSTFAAPDAGLSTLLLLFLCFVVPNELSSGGFISIRLLLCFLIFLSLWAGTYLRQGILPLLVVGGMLLLNLWQIHYHYSEARHLSKDATRLMKAEAHIPEGSTVLPLNYSYHWLQYNIGNYLGAENDIIVLDNYEADKSHFPVEWNQGMAPMDRLGNFGFSKRPLLKIEPYEEETGARVDFVVLWQHDDSYNDSATTATLDLLRQKFEPVHRTGDGAVKLFARRKYQDGPTNGENSR